MSEVEPETITNVPVADIAVLERTEVDAAKSPVVAPVVILATVAGPFTVTVCDVAPCVIKNTPVIVPLNPFNAPKTLVLEVPLHVATVTQTPFPWIASNPLATTLPSNVGFKPFGWATLFYPLLVHDSYLLNYGRLRVKLLL